MLGHQTVRGAVWRPRLALLLLPLIFVPNTARRDSVKHDFFVFGIHLGSAECVAGLASPAFTFQQQGAADLVRRNLEWSIGAAARLNNQAAPIVQLQAEFDRLSFADVQRRLGETIIEYQTFYAGWNVQSSGLFVAGVHHAGAECIASHVRSFSVAQRPGSLDLIKRNVTWMAENIQNQQLGLNLEPLNAILDAIDGRVPFGVLYGMLVQLRTDWQQELLVQAPFGTTYAGNSPPIAPTPLRPSNTYDPPVPVGPRQPMVELQRQDGVDPDGDPLSSYVKVFQFDRNTSQWVSVHEGWAPGTSFTFTGLTGLTLGDCYAWLVGVADRERRSQPWWAESNWSYFCTGPSTSTTATEVPVDECDQSCAVYCRSRGMSGGRLGEKGVCLLGEVSQPAVSCQCQ